jgi:hypothetical protein
MRERPINFSGLACADQGGNHLLLGTNGLTGAGVLGNFFKVAIRRIPVAPDLDPNL